MLAERLLDKSVRTTRPLRARYKGRSRPPTPEPPSPHERFVNAALDLFPGSEIVVQETAS